MKQARGKTLSLRSSWRIIRRFMILSWSRCRRTGRRRRKIWLPRELARRQLPCNTSSYSRKAFMKRKSQSWRMKLFYWSQITRPTLNPSKTSGTKKHGSTSRKSSKKKVKSSRKNTKFPNAQKWSKAPSSFRSKRFRIRRTSCNNKSRSRKSRQKSLPLKRSSSTKKSKGFWSPLRKKKGTSNSQRTNWSIRMGLSSSLISYS